MSSEDKTKAAQKIYDAVLNAFPNLRKFMLQSQKTAATKGYVETILGRRRHIPDMQLPKFEFHPMSGYVNPDLDPMDISTLQNRDGIPSRIIDELQQEFNSYKYFGQIAKRTRELYDQKIRVVNNSTKIGDASRKCVNSIVQGSAAEMTKMAILLLEQNEEWKKLGGRLLVPVHDELIAEVPIDEWEEGGKLLSNLMSEAGKFLPFPINCDVETSLRWYGLSYPCPYPKPESLSDMSEEEVKWVQYHLCELEYTLPIYNDSEGNKPRGDAAKGVNGIISDEYELAVYHYMNRYNLQSDIEFINHIDKKVIQGE